MKIKHLFSILVLGASCASVTVFSQSTNRDDREPGRDLMPNSRMHLGRLEKASTLLGLEIKDNANQKLGKVEDLAIDIKNGRIVEVIVATGGVLGMDERYTAVPPQALNWDQAGKILTVNQDKERFQRAPSFKLSAWEDNVQQSNVGLVYQYYDTRPYFNDPNNGHAQSAGTYQFGEIERASKVLGSAVRNSQNERLGKIENLLVDLPAGRVVEVVVASGGFLGMGGELSAIPPQAFSHGVERDVLILDKTKAELSQSPHFKSQEWPDLNNPQAHADSVYRAYNVEPYFSTNAADNTAQNVRDRADGALTPLSQGNSAGDIDISRKIRQEIMALDGLSMNARNVKVITVNGHVTLRGPVDNAQEQKQITDIANRIATPAQVDNQIQVKSNSTNPMPVSQ